MIGRLATLGVLLGAAACGSAGPRPLVLGEEQCTHCHMTLADARFAGELITTTGKVIPVDDVGCLAMYVHLLPGDVKIRSLWVNDFANPDSLFDATGAVYLRSDSLRTPMDYHMVAFRQGRTADSVRAVIGGDLLSWDQVLRMISEIFGQ
jgi:copper chaperone NosL